MKRPGESRRRLNVLSRDFFPAYVVWELTLACDHACTHCGSRAAVKRETELTTLQALGVVGELAAMGTREVVLIGGEAYLHDGFLEIVAALAKAGVRPTMTTGGFGVDEALATRMRAAGLEQMSVSVDGLEPTHDRMRAKRGSFAAAMRALDNARAAGIQVTANTNVNRFNRGDLEELYEVLKDKGIRAWQIQITTPLGRAADRTNMVLQPYDLLDVVPRVAALKRLAAQDGVQILPGNNLGYFGPEEALLRSPIDKSNPDAGTDHWAGCQAGRYVLGIESDGAVKGCPSLQTKSYVGGKLPERKLEAIWGETPELAFTRDRTTEDLWGWCKECPFASVCLGGCSFTAHAVFGRPGNNPYCHFRARSFAKRGLRERLVPATAAEGTPFDNGTFEAVVEPFDAPEPEDIPREELVRITRRPTLSVA